MNDEPTTYKEAASQLQISVESFQDRIKGAVKKQRKLLPELNLLPPTPFARNETNLLYGGLYWKEKAVPHSLYRIDSQTGQKAKIDPNPNGPQPQKMDETKRRNILSHLDATTNVPDFIDNTSPCPSGE